MLAAMDTSMVVAFALVAAFFALVISLVVYSVTQEKRRRKVFEAMAPAMGLTFQASDDTQPLRYSHLETFSRGTDKRASNLMVGTIGHAEACVFDYRFITHGVRSHTTTLKTVCILRASDLDLPQFTLRREVPLLDRLVEAVEGQDIDFEEDREFSRKMVLRGKDPEATRRLFTADLRAHFLRYHASMYSFEGGDNLLVVDCGLLVKPAKLGELLKQMGETVALLRFASHAAR
jgi:hypothetical protein